MVNVKKKGLLRPVLNAGLAMTPIISVFVFALAAFASEKPIWIETEGETHMSDIDMSKDVFKDGKDYRKYIEILQNFYRYGKREEK